MKNSEFSFASIALGFEQHLGQHMPGNSDLRKAIVSLAPTLVQSGTNVVDIGTSSGALLRMVHDEVERCRSAKVTYLGIDPVADFQADWAQLTTPNLSFVVADACEVSYEQLSLAMSVFTLQFIPRHRRKQLLRSLYEGMVDGGYLIITEKVLASSARFQDALTFPYYDFKRAQGITAEQILDKERSLRGFLTPYDRDELVDLLKEAGFKSVEEFWCRFPFVGLIASK